MARVSIIIPLYGAWPFTERSLTALEARTPKPWELVLVDNGSTDETMVQPVQVRNERNRGFAIGCNMGAEYAAGDVLVFLNSDTEVQDGWLAPMVSRLDDPTVGVVGAKLVNPDGSVQHTGVGVDFSRPPGGEAWGMTDNRPAGNVPAVTGACMALRRDVFDELGGFDRGFWNGYEDVDLCLRAGAAGYRVVYEPGSVVMHAESASGPERWTAVRQNVQRLRARWS